MICRIIVPGVDRNCQGTGINVPSATISRFASPVTSTYPNFFGHLGFLCNNVEQRSTQHPSDPSFPGKAPFAIGLFLGMLEWC